MSELNSVKFRKLALSIFKCFPNVNKISISEKNNCRYLDLWKNVGITMIDYEFVNSNYVERPRYFWQSNNFNNAAKTVGLFGRIPLNFFGYDSVNVFADDIVLDRRSFRIDRNQIQVNNENDLSKMVNKICNYSSVKSMTFESFGKVKLKNNSEQIFEISMRGSGLRTSVRNEINKSC